MSRFQDQVVWVTGASSGIGEAMAKEWVKRGAKVILTARRDDRLNKLAEQLNRGAASTRAKVLVADLSDLEGLSALTEKAITCFGQVDVLFNNAGAIQYGFVADTPFEVEHRIIKLDLLSPIALTKALLPHFMKRKSGRILVTSSLMGDLELPGYANYACVKHGLNGYFYSLAFELAEHGILVQVLQPGYVRTELSMSALDSEGNIYGKMEPALETAISADAFAAKVLPKIERGNVMIIVAGMEGFAITIRRWFPRFYRFAVAKFGKYFL